MLLFCPVRADLDLDRVRTEGLLPGDSRVDDTGGAGLPLWTTLEAAEQAGDGPLLVVDLTALAGPPRRASAERLRVDRVPADALRNAAPYRPPTHVVAGGGYVVCPLDGAPEDKGGDPDASDGEVALLLIHRKGAWDLPKGKRDPGETNEACALREVREEVGIDDLRATHPLGTTQHGYPDGEAYAVKTTHWYLMRTPERSFTPETREGIRRVAWARWPVARRHIGYDTLARHMDQVETQVRERLAGAAPRAGA